MLRSTKAETEGPVLMTTTAAFIDRYSSAEALAHVASAPLIVCELIWQVTGGDREHLTLFRNGCRLRQSDAITTVERYAVVWVARTFTRASFPQIGRAMGMDHSSIIRAFRRAETIHLRDRDFRLLTNKLALVVPRRVRVQKRAQALLLGVGR
jgi:hypothetical protein